MLREPVRAADLTFCAAMHNRKMAAPVRRRVHHRTLVAGNGINIPAASAASEASAMLRIG